MEVPGLRATLSQVSPSKAADIRSVVTGDLKRNEGSGLLSFERTVETTFVLPWDLDPKVKPAKLSSSVCDTIRYQLMDKDMLDHLESCGGINWNPVLIWQYRGTNQKEWMSIDPALSSEIEIGYSQDLLQLEFVLSFTTFHVNYVERSLFNASTEVTFEIRRLAFAPLMPMKTEYDQHSLYHAASLGFWGIHDRTALLQQAVNFTLSDPKAQFVIYERWSQEIGRSSQARPEFPQWERAKSSLAESPQLHIFTLSNIVQRPIIVYAHPNSNVGGVYLPLLWEDAHKQFLCERLKLPHLKTSLILGYNASTHHFAPLVTFKGSKGPTPLLHPLSYQNSLLPIHFLSDSQVSEGRAPLLSRLLFVDLIPPAPTPAVPSQTLAAVSPVDTMPDIMDTLVKQYQSLFL